MWRSNEVRPDPIDILWHTALGYMPDFLDVDEGTVGWVRRSHRGVYRTDHIHIPTGQRRYVFSKKFEFRLNTAFEEVVRACADVSRPSIQKRLGKTWLTEDLIRGLLRLYDLGFAHSYETWQEGKLVGGIYGVQIGGFVTMPSMFYRVSHASKAALGRGLLHLKERGFEMVDWGAPPDHQVNYGIEWWPRWKYESTLLRLCRQERALADDRPAPALPWQLRFGLPAVKVARGIGRRVRGLLPRQKEGRPAGAGAQSADHPEATGAALALETAGSAGEEAP